MAIPDSYAVISREQIVNLDYENEVYPYKAISDLRKKGPLLKVDDGGWIATSYDFVNSLFRDKRFLTMNVGKMASRAILQKRNPIVKTIVSPPLKVLINKDKQVKISNSWLIFSDPPNHTRLRKLSQTAFTPRAIKNLLPRMKEITYQLLDQVEKKQEFDLIQDFALPLPITIISEILGVASEDSLRFKKWSQSILTGFSFFNMTKEKRANAIQAIDEITEYLESEIKKRESNPQEDVISYFVTAKEDNDSMTHNEIVSNVVLLLIAGHETTVNLITNTV